MKKIFVMILVTLAMSCNSQTIEFVVSASPGGPNDTVTRKLVERLNHQNNLQFIVTNRPGAAHVIAYNYVNNSNKPTLILETSEIEKHEVFSKVEELYNIGYFSSVVFVSKKSGIKNLKDLIELSNQRPINFGHGGIGTYSHMSMDLMCKKINCLDIPYKSGIEGMTAILAGTIDAYSLVSYGSKQFIENDNYVAIHNLRVKEKSWFKLFSKNLSDKDKEIIQESLRSIDSSFFRELGLDTK